MNSADTAEEAVRAAHVRAFANLDRYEPAGKFGAWLARLAFNEALALRRHSPLTGVPTTKADGAPAPSMSAGRLGSNAITATAVRNTGSANPPLAGTPLMGVPSATATASDPADPAAGRQQLESAIDALPEVFRTVLVLRVVEDLSGVEVAVCLGLNETTVRTRLYRAQQRLKVDVARRLRAAPANIFELTSQRCDQIVTQVFAKLHSVTPGSESR